MTVKNNTRSGIGVVVIAQNDSETIERSVLSYYDHVDYILLSTDPKRGHSGKPIVPDNTVELVRALDKDSKVEIVEGDFVKTDDPMKNETYQRQFSADLLKTRGDWTWIFQIDADEIFLDFQSVLAKVRALKFAQFVYWRWLSVFNILDDGRLLIIVEDDGRPNLLRFPLAHRPGAALRKAREIERPMDFRYKLFKWRYEGGKDAKDAVLHFSYAKSEKRIKEKLATFSHSKDFDGDKLYELWLGSKTDWQSLKNFHPIDPHLWPALRPYTLDELKGVAQSLHRENG